MLSDNNDNFIFVPIIDIIIQMSFYKSILAENVDGVAQFIARMVSYEGEVHVEKLHIVELVGNTPIVRTGEQSDKRSNYALATGGEVVNSFSPLYEVGYFSQCLFLAGVGTAAIHKGLINKYKHLAEANLLEIIKSDVSQFTESDIFEGMKKPEIAIISNMDTDVVPLRYLKHQLWRLDPACLTKRVAEITPGQYGKLPPPVINPQYWTETDQRIAEVAMQSAGSLLHAKIIQYYLVLQIFFRELDIDIANIPIYFNFVPKEEIIANGPDSSLLEVLIGLHTPEAKVKYHKLTGINVPWILAKACPKCGQGDKRIVATRIMGDGITVKARCKPNQYAFRNEHGDEVIIKGCGYEFSFIVPTDPHKLYDFLMKEDFSIHFATRELLAILKDASNNPLGLVVTDLGILCGKNGKLLEDPNRVKGYGDNLYMLISSIALQYFFIHEKIAGKTARELKKRNLLLSYPMLLLAYDRQTELVDTEVVTRNKIGKITPVADTSALKALEKGHSAKEMFKQAVRLHAFSLEELLQLKGKSVDLIEKKLAFTSARFSSTLRLQAKQTS